MSLEEKYKTEVIPAMMKKFGKSSPMAVPKIEKVVVNTGYGRLVSGKSSKEIESIVKSIMEDIALITGQRPIMTRAKKSISGFKLREGIPIGAKVTLRGKMMNDFLTRLINIALPRSRDFQGLDAKFFDKSGNLTIGMKEQITFPEISPEKTRNIFGLEITVVTTAKGREESIELLRLMGFPIKQK